MISKWYSSFGGELRYREWNEAPQQFRDAQLDGDLLYGALAARGELWKVFIRNEQPRPDTNPGLVQEAQNNMFLPSHSAFSTAELLYRHSRQAYQYISDEMN